MATQTSHKMQHYTVKCATDLETVIAGKRNHRLQPCFMFLWLCGVSPHLCALIHSLNQDLKLSMFSPNIIVETHLWSKKCKVTSCHQVTVYMPKLLKRRILLPDRSDWAERSDCSGLLWLCFLWQVTGRGNVLKKREIHCKEKFGLAVCLINVTYSNLMCCCCGHVWVPGPQLFWSIRGASQNSGSSHRVPPQSRTSYIWSLQQKTHFILLCFTINLCAGIKLWGCTRHKDSSTQQSKETKWFFSLRRNSYVAKCATRDDKTLVITPEICPTGSASMQKKKKNPIF